MKNTSAAVHQSQRLSSQESSPRAIRTLPQQLHRWPTRSLYRRCRSFHQLTISTNISTSLASEPTPAPAKGTARWTRPHQNPTMPTSLSPKPHQVTTQPHQPMNNPTTSVN